MSTSSHRAIASLCRRVDRTSCERLVNKVQLHSCILQKSRVSVIQFEKYMYGKRWRHLHNESWLAMQRMMDEGFLEEVYKWFMLFRNTGHFTHLMFVSHRVRPFILNVCVICNPSKLTNLPILLSVCE